MPALENLQLGCGICRIFCFTIGQKLCCRKPKLPRPDFSVICLGFSGAGKSTLLSLLCGEDLANIDGPTTGFSIKAVQFDECIMNIKEIGGGEKIRPFWQHYFNNTQGLIFVVNSAAPEEEIEEVRDAVYKSLNHPALRGLPCMVLANCQDLPDARTYDQMVEILELNDSCSDREWVLVTCSMKDIDKLRQDFSKFIAYFVKTEPQGEDGPQQSPTHSQGEDKGTANSETNRV